MLAYGFGFCMWRETFARADLFLLSVEEYSVASKLCDHVPELLVPGFGRPILLCWAR